MLKSQQTCWSHNKHVEVCIQTLESNSVSQFFLDQYFGLNEFFCLHLSATLSSFMKLHIPSHAEDLLREMCLWALFPRQSMFTHSDLWGRPIWYSTVSNLAGNFHLPKILSLVSLFFLCVSCGHATDHATVRQQLSGASWTENSSCTSLASQLFEQETSQHFWWNSHPLACHNTRLWGSISDHLQGICTKHNTWFHWVTNWCTYFSKSHISERVHVPVVQGICTKKFDLPPPRLLWFVFVTPFSVYLRHFVPSPSLRTCIWQSKPRAHRCLCSSPPCSAKFKPSWHISVSHNCIGFSFPLRANAVTRKKQLPSVYHLPLC